MLFPKARLRKQAAFSLIETSTAMGLVGLFIAVLMVMSSNLMGLLRSSRDSASASQALQERAEQIRAANWLQITDGSLLVKEIFSGKNSSTPGLGSAAEVITVSAYPADSTVTPVKVSFKDGAATVLALNPKMKEQRMVRVDVNLSWTGYPNKRNHIRTATALVSRTASNKR
jgi:hypothetical protein